jgi:NTP pyrophosphatase (non-canonical NTP hydrolase)
MGRDLIYFPGPQTVHAEAVKHGWYDQVAPDTMGKYFIPAQLALIHSEISEALEAYRKDGVPDPGEAFTVGDGSFVEELADAVLRIIDLCGFLQIDIEHAVEVKHQYNLTREHRNGGKIV